MIISDCVVKSVYPCWSSTWYFCFHSTLGTKSAPLQARHDSLRQPVDDIVSNDISCFYAVNIIPNPMTLLFAAQTEGGDDLNYAALHLSGRRASREKRREPEAEESLYAQVKCRVWMCVKNVVWRLWCDLWQVTPGDIGNIVISSWLWWESGVAW